MFDNISKYSWLSFVPMISLGILTIGLLIIGVIPRWYLILSFIGWVFIAGLGVAVGYHRVFSHNTHPNLPRWKENTLLFFGTLSGQGSSLVWSAIHRGYHHKYSDTLKDLHSPIHGKFYAFFTWTTKITQNNLGFNMKYAANLLRKSNHIWFHNNQFKILWGVPVLIALIDWKLSLMLVCLPTAISLLQDNLTNLFGHWKAIIGYRNFETPDNSHNNIVLGYLGWGQGWHNNHHYDPKSFDFGTSISGKWWEFDPCKIFLPFLKV
jgi:stearoyl-CoA desaturase (delta-9 desaturase)